MLVATSCCSLQQHINWILLLALHTLHGQQQKHPPMGHVNSRTPFFSAASRSWCSSTSDLCRLPALNVSSACSKSSDYVHLTESCIL